MRVLLFAQIKDAVGASELELEVSGALGLDHLWANLIAEEPKLAPYRKTTRIACNGEYADAKTKFRDGDEVALIPPVSGG